MTPRIGMSGKPGFLRLSRNSGKQRGLYPGLLKALKVADAVPLIENVKALCGQEGQAAAFAAAFEVLDQGKDNKLTRGLTSSTIKKIQRSWMLQSEGARLLLREVLPRLDLPEGL